MTRHNAQQAIRDGLDAVYVERLSARDAVSDRQNGMVSYSVAAPVRDAGGEVVAAVSVVLPTGTRPDAATPAVRTRGRAISRAPGSRSG